MQRRVLVLVQTSISSSKLGFEHGLVMYLLIINWFWIIFNQTKALKCLSLNIVTCHHVRFGEWQSARHREFIQVSPSTCVTSYSCSDTAVFPVSLSRSESTSGDLHHFSPVCASSDHSEVRRQTVSRTRTENLNDTETDLQRHSALRPGEAHEEENQERRRRCCHTGRPQLEKQREREKQMILMWKERRN